MTQRVQHENDLMRLEREAEAVAWEHHIVLAFDPPPCEYRSYQPYVIHLEVRRDDHAYLILQRLLDTIREME